jgi:hypothetical protein
VLTVVIIFNYPAADRSSVSRLSRYDLLLAAIALPMTVAGAVGAFTSLAMSTTLAAASLPAGGTVGYALFVATPGEPED